MNQNTASFRGDGAMGIFAACRSEKLNAKLAQAFRGLDPSFHGRKSARHLTKSPDSNEGKLLNHPMR